MAKYILTILSLLISISSFSQNGLENGNLFILPKSKNRISVNNIENDNLNELKSFSINKNSIYATDQQSKVGIINTSKNAILLFDIKTSKKSKISIPYDIKPKSILINQENIFVGGEMGKEMLVQYNFKDEIWYQLEIPDEIAYKGKAVDDIVINDSLLIAIDNIITPKYVLYYNLNSKEKLKLSHFNELKSNSSYESIHQARITNKYLGLYSTTMNWGTISEHITIYADLELKKSFAISVDYYEKNTFNDFIILDEKLYIANRLKGLGILTIDNIFFKESKDEFDIFNYRIDEKLIKYKKYSGEEIVKITKVPFQQKFILTLKNKNSKYRHEIIAL